MNELIKKIIKSIRQKKRKLSLWYEYQDSNKTDEEMFYVSQILDKKRRFLDIGASIGIYSYHFKNTFEKIDAFEPLPEITYRLEAYKNESLKIHNNALSNKVGEFQLYIPLKDKQILSPLASLEKRESDCEVRTVRVNTLDSYNFDDVDLIKIDVEGHEHQVIEGSIKTIKKNMPIMIIEIEQRHIKNRIDEVFRYITSLNYSGFFLNKGELISLNEFSYEVNQKPYLDMFEASEYINNFIFIPRSVTSPLKTSIRPLFVISSFTLLISFSSTKDPWISERLSHESG